MKTPAFVLCVLFVPSVLLLAGDAPNRPQDTPPPAVDNRQAGRFVLLSGRYDSMGSMANTVIRMDTATGQAWELTTITLQSNPRVHVTGWTKLEENPLGIAKYISDFQNRTTNSSPEE